MDSIIIIMVVGYILVSLLTIWAIGNGTIELIYEKLSVEQLKGLIKDCREELHKRKEGETK